MKEIIMDVHEESPKDFGRGILERVLGYSDYHARDDMTVLVAGVWKNNVADTRVCLKKAFCKMCVTICGIFCRMRARSGLRQLNRVEYPAKWGVADCGNDFSDTL